MMDNALMELALAAAAFLLGHFFLSHPPVRGRLVGKLGDKAFMGVYSVISLLTFFWMLNAFGRAPQTPFYEPVTFFLHWPMSFVLLASILVIAGVTVANPTMTGKPLTDENDPLPGILKITRHPVLWGIGLWGFSHMAANPADTTWIFFGALTVLALAGALHIDHRKRAEGDERWARIVAETSFVPFAAIIQKRTRLGLLEIGWWRIVLGLALYGGLLAAHSSFFGVSPLPLPV